MGILKSVPERKRTFGLKELGDYLVMGKDAQERSALGQRALFDAARATGAHAMEDYLAHGHGAAESRLRAFAHSNNLPDGCEGTWAERMDETKRSWEKRGTGRQYYHWIVSPDPEDKVSPSECAQVAGEWAEAAHPGYEWVAVVHDDNANEVVHAHVVMNSVNPETGYKMHRNAKAIDAEWDVMQLVCAEHGLADLPTAGEYRAKRNLTQQLERQSQIERAMRARGVRSWVAEIRDSIDSAAQISRTWEDFLTALAETGVTIHRESARRGAGLVFTHPDGSEHEMRVRARRLGAAYTEDALRARFGTDFDGLWHGRPEPRIPGPLSGALSRHERRVGLRPRPVPIERWCLQARSRRAALRSIQGSLRGLATLRREGIGTVSELVAKMSILEREVSDLERRATQAEGAVEEALGIYRAAREAEALLPNLAALENESKGLRFLDPSLRRARKEARDQMSRLRKVIDEGFAGAQEFMAENGLEGASDLERARALLRMCRRYADDSRERAESIAGRLEDLRITARAVESTRLVVGNHKPARAHAAPRGRLKWMGPEVEAATQTNVPHAPSQGARAREEAERRRADARLATDRVRIAEMLSAAPAPSAGNDGRVKQPVTREIENRRVIRQ